MEKKLNNNETNFKKVMKIVILSVVILIPIIYSFFYLKSYWDPYKDLTSEANKFTTGSVEVKQIESIKQEDEEKDDNGDTTEYSTNTFMFDKKDFVTEDTLKEHLSGTNKFIKVLIFLLVIAILLGAYYVITTYVLK